MPFRYRKHDCAAHAHVLADLGDERGQTILHRTFRCGMRKNLLEIAFGLERGVGSILHKSLELVVARNEVGLGIHLDQCADIALRDDADQAFRRNAASLFRGLRQALLAQPVDGGFHIAVRLAKRRLAVHHACAGLVAQSFTIDAVMFDISLNSKIRRWRVLPRLRLVDECPQGRRPPLHRRRCQTRPGPDRCRR